MRCPHCSGPLHDAQEGVPFRAYRCGDHGTFVAGEDLAAATLRALRNLVARGSATKMPCPQCATALRETLLEPPGLALDVCHVCDGVWFDRGELERVPRPPERAGPATWTYSPVDGAVGLVDDHVANDPLYGWILAWALRGR